MVEVLWGELEGTIIEKYLLIIRQCLKKLNFIVFDVRFDGGILKVGDEFYLGEKN